MPHNFERETFIEYGARLHDPKVGFEARFNLDSRRLTGMISGDVSVFPRAFSSYRDEEVFTQQVFIPAETIANDYLMETENDYTSLSPGEYLLKLYMLDPWGHQEQIQQAYERVQADKEQK